MPRRTALPTFVLALALSAAACASTERASDPRDAAPTGVVAAAREWEPWPPAEAARHSAPPAPSGQIVRLKPKDGGWRMDDLLAFVSAKTGASFLYDNGNASFKQAKLEFVGDFDVPESELFAWLQGVLSYRKLVMVPVGPKAADGRQQWLLMDQADPNLKSRPTYVDESELVDYADRDGLYVVTVMRLRDTVDPTRARNALSPLSTQLAGIGRIQDTGGRHLIVGDFAPVVASMKRMLDRINADTPPSAVRPAPTPVVAPKPAEK